MQTCFVSGQAGQSLVQPGCTNVYTLTLTQLTQYACQHYDGDLSCPTVIQELKSNIVLEWLESSRPHGCVMRQIGVLPNLVVLRHQSWHISNRYLLTTL